MLHNLDVYKNIEWYMIAYAFYYNPKVYNSKDTTKTMEQPVHQMNMVQLHDYLDVD